MKITPRFATAIKYLLLFAVFMFVYSFFLTYQGMSGISISHPSENTNLRVVLNNLKGLLMMAAFWLSIGYITKDYTAAIAALLVSLFVNFGLDYAFPRSIASTEGGIRQYLFSGASMLPYLTFGLLHFKSSQAIKLLAIWAVIWGLGISHDSHVFERMVEGFSRIVGIRDPFELKISTGDSSYRPISILRLVASPLILLVNVSVFWFLYRIIKNKASIWEGLHTCHMSIHDDKLTYSAIYWSFRLTLFVSALGVTTYIGRLFRMDFDVLSFVRVIAFAYGIVVITALYRNYLTAHFVRKGQYPGGLYFLLNIPIINVLAWLYSILTFSVATVENTSSLEKVQELKKEFMSNGRNMAWKVLIIILTFCTMLYQLNRAGFRLDGPSRDGVFWILVLSLISFSLMLWYLFDKNAYLPIIVILAANIILVLAVRSESLLRPTIAAGIVNVVLYYGLFYFDELKWKLSPATPTREHDL